MIIKSKEPKALQGNHEIRRSSNSSSNNNISSSSKIIITSTMIQIIRGEELGLMI